MFSLHKIIITVKFFVNQEDYKSHCHSVNLNSSSQVDEITQ